MKKNTEVYTIEIDWGLGETNTYRIFLARTSYQNNGSLAVVAFEPPRGACVSAELFDTITVNLPMGMADETHAYIDTNNCPWAVKFLKDNKLAKPTGEFACSGWCKYPLYEFDLSKFSK